MALRLRGSESGYAEIDAPAVAGDVTLTLPSTTGTINVKDASGNTEVGTGVTFGNPSANIFTIDTNGSERLRIAADGTVSIPGALNVSGVLTYEDVTSVDAIGLSTFRDGLNTKDVGLNAISSTDINDDTVNAVDVFIYDTSKDSDGGAWRKRTTNTSWYNETLNTATRGSRREFPAVAVIVSESDTLTIYDGDDPDLPMWMVFTTTGTVTANAIVRTSGYDISTVSMVNGLLVCGVNYNGGFEINFVSDKCHRRNPSVYAFGGNVASRNGGMNFINVNTTAVIVNTIVNDVAMTVLPNAPIDDATGLPIPTIALATDGGVSVIKDDGTVIDKATTSDASYQVDWMSSSRLLMTAPLYYGIYDNPLVEESAGYLSNTSDSSYYHSDGDGSSWNYPRPIANLVNNTGQRVIATDSRTIVAATNSGLNIHELSTSSGTDNNDGIVAYAATSYNTGWMHGDIKGAFLSGISTASVTGSDFITNGNFDDTDISYWNPANGATLTHQTNGNPGGNINVASGPSSNGYASRSHTVVVGKYYTLSFDHYHVDGSQGYVNIGTSTGGSEYIYHQLGTSSSWTPFSFTIKATSTNLFTGFYSRPNGNVRYDNIVLREADPDRSVNNKGLQVFGTITKTVVATGADLVAYSNFSTSNYLQQPYNSDLDLDSGDFSISVWIYPTVNDSDYKGIVSRGSNGVYGPYALAYNNQRITFVASEDWNESNDGGSWGTVVQSTDGDTPINQWSHIVVRHSGTTTTVYRNGVVIGTDTSAVNPKAPTTNFIPTMIGVERTPLTGAIGRPWEGSLALIRVSASAPSPEQIKKIYEDEKVLFQENAACTLYGSSDAVTALAYDEVTDQLHVGTSSGRSNFQGLRRINNTTDPVTTAISAHDSFIIEQ